MASEVIGPIREAVTAVQLNGCDVPVSMSSDSLFVPIDYRCWRLPLLGQGNCSCTVGGGYHRDS